MPETVDSIILHSQARELGITFAPGPLFSAQPGKFRNCLRLNAAFWSDRVFEGVALLGSLAMDMHHGKRGDRPR